MTETTCDDDFPSEEWILNSSAAAWECHVRDASKARVVGECVLDATRHTILNFQQGKFKFIEHDLRSVLPGSMARSALTVCDEQGVPAAYELRRNTVNLKKVLLHSWWGGASSTLA